MIYCSLTPYNITCIQQIRSSYGRDGPGLGKPTEPSETVRMDNSLREAGKGGGASNNAFNDA